MTPEVSIVMPVHNGASWLHEAVESVLRQSFTAFELLIIDDGSQDESPAISSRFARRDRRVRVIRQSKLDLASTLNRGFSEAAASVIARIDADDRAAPERIECQIRFLRAHPEIGLVGSWAEKIDARGRHLGWLRPETRSRELIGILQWTNPFIHSSIMLRADIARRLGGYRRAFKAAEDYDLWLRFAEVTNVANLPEFLVQYRRHARNVSKHDELRQAFSARLARNCAAMRRQGFADAANDLTGPPDWHSPGSRTAFYSKDAELYRLLDLVDAGQAEWRSHLDVSPLIARFDELSHAERKLAVFTMISCFKYARGAGGSHARRRIIAFVRRHPGAMLPLVRAALQASFSRT